MVMVAFHIHTSLSSLNTDLICASSSTDCLLFCLLIISSPVKWKWPCEVGKFRLFFPTTQNRRFCLGNSAVYCVLNQDTDEPDSHISHCLCRDHRIDKPIAIVASLLSWKLQLLEPWHNVWAKPSWVSPWEAHASLMTDHHHLPPNHPQGPGWSKGRTMNVVLPSPAPLRTGMHHPSSWIHPPAPYHHRVNWVTTTSTRLREVQQTILLPP